MKYLRLESKIDEAGQKLREIYKEKLIKGGILQSGKLFNSIDYRIEVTETSTNLYFQGEDYYINVEDGRKPNSKMPPVSAIRSWMITRGIPITKGLDFIIARSIGKKGIKPRPYLRETKIDLKEFEIQFQEALELDIKEFYDDRIKGKIKIELTK